MSEGPINFGGAGDIDMLPTEARAAMRRLQQAGTAFGNRWTVLSTAIRTGELEANTGFDTLSKGFRDAYNPAKEPIQQASDATGGAVGGLGAQGNQIVGQYVQSAQRDAARMRAVGDL
ncbi:hypothetical protein [Kribbella italica]|uniref:Uncharacterized protein n=1 Tax=Kribbella italica TaxID=1540520 RepID=A0A7W9MY73_9ACTN|nr:hypothetical protein [Kribbella italica]MBB5840107.1 hypothetical protein [Kribbella italica]